MSVEQPWLLVLGTAQDGGFPQAGCQKKCCRQAWTMPAIQRQPCAMALIDPRQQKRWLLDCTPALSQQLDRLDKKSESSWEIEGIFLTHAHMGHYTGLLHLGREVMGSKAIPVYVMPKMREFLENNAPWLQLIEHDHIQLYSLQERQSVVLGEHLSITPWLVPHRGEISETVAFVVEGPDKKALYLPDIDGWESWPVEDMLRRVDAAWLDGTFFDHHELPDRDRDQIPHPCIADSIDQWQGWDREIRKKIRFTHLNHSNPVCLPGSEQEQTVKKTGYRLAVEDEVFFL